jgi:hypothetical protein
MSSEGNRAERRRANRADRRGQAAKEIEEWEIEREWEIDPEFQAWVMHVRTKVAPMVSDSGMTISIVPKTPEDVDVKFAVELGLSIMFDKPLILCCDPSTEIPDRLRRVADHIVVGDTRDQSTQHALQDAVRAVWKEQGDEE